MALKSETLIIDGIIVKNAYITVKPLAIIKEERSKSEEKETYFVFVQKYNIFIKGDDNKSLNYEQEFDIDINKPSYDQCYENLKSKEEYKQSINS